MDNTVLNAKDILKEYGGVNKNMLENILSAYEHHDTELQTLKHSPYYSVDNLPKYLCIKNGNFTILSINVDGLLSKIDELSALIELLQQQNIMFDVICIQESHLDNSYKHDTACIQLNGYDCKPQGKTCGQKGGLVTYIKSNYESEYYTIPDDNSISDIWEGLYVEVKDPDSYFRIMICNIYKPPRNNNDNRNIERFTKELIPKLQKIDSLGCEVAVPGDFNINLLKLHEKLKFQALFDDLTNLSLFPKITLPTRIGKQSSTLIDNIYCKLTHRTADTKSGILFSDISDHFPCFVSLNLNTKPKAPPKMVKQKFSTPNAVQKFKDELIKHDFTKDFDHSVDSNPSSNYDAFIDKVIEIKNDIIPTKIVKFNKHRHKKEDWITSGIIKSIAFRDKLRLKKTKTNIYSPDYEIISQNIQTYNKIIKDSIRLSKIKHHAEKFTKYKDDIKNTWKHISSLITKSSRKEISQIRIKIKVSGKDTEIKIKDKLTMANEFNNFYANIGPQLASSIDTNNKRPFDSYMNNPATTAFNFKHYTTDDTQKIIDSLKTKTSTGNDGISTQLIKVIAPGILKPLTALLNQSLKTGIFPNNLKLAKIIPLHKKESRELMDNYRPVSLLNALSKIFERAVYNQLYEYFKKNNYFYKNQYGFRDEHSTELAANELIDRVLEDLDKKCNPIVIYMDLSKAFDTLDHTILLKKLEYYGVNGTELQWFKNYISNRKQYVEIAGHQSSLANITTGVPQGSILGPLLFLIYMNDIPFSSKHFDFILFADDTSLKSYMNIHSHTFSKKSVSDMINAELAKVHDWLAVNKLSLNVKKTKFMVFHTRQKNLQLHIPELKIGDKIIDRVENFDFLGLTLNENMCWKPHVNKIASKISKYVGILNRLKRYVPSHILQMIYNSIVQSNLNYCILAWGYNCGRLKVLQRKAIRTITNSKYNAHTSPLFKKLSLLKLEDMFKINMLKWYHKYVNGKLPHYFKGYKIQTQEEIHNHDTRNKSEVTRPLSRIQAARKCLRNHISVIIRATTPNVLDKTKTHSFQGFGRYAKDRIIEQYQEECVIENCYICNRDNDSVN